MRREGDTWLFQVLSSCHVETLVEQLFGLRALQLSKSKFTLGSTIFQGWHCRQVLSPLSLSFPSF